MTLYTVDYNAISAADKKIWEELKEKEVVGKLGTTNIIKSIYAQYPKSVRHFLSLFPNNFIDAVDLRLNKDELSKKVLEFENLISDTSITERAILNFIKKKNAHFILGSILSNGFTFGHHALYLFPEFKLSTNFQVDYLLIGKNSHGHHFVFVELENPYGRITRSDGSYGEVLSKGINQVNDWEHWLEPNFDHLHTIFEQSKKRGANLPEEFRDFDATRIHFAVVAGRRSKYNDKTYRLNRKELDRKRHILHYDNLIDYSKEIIGKLTY